MRTMKPVRAIASGVLVALVSASSFGSQLLPSGNITGHWSGTSASSGEVARPIEFVLVQEGTQVTGTVILGPHLSIPIQNGKIEDNKVRFHVVLPQDAEGGKPDFGFELGLEGDLLRGKMIINPAHKLERTLALHLLKPPVGEKLSPYLFVWASTTDPQKNDFLAVVDALPQSKQYGRVVATLPVDYRGGMAHHTEHQMTPAGTLFANLFEAGRSYLFDLREPLSPRLLTSFDNFGPYSHPHSFVREPSGNVLATFQQSGEGNKAPGGLVELSPDGKLIRASSAQDPDYRGFMRPYSLAIVPGFDRVVTTCYDMEEKEATRAVQIWRLSDLHLLKTIELPTGPRGVEGQDSGEPRLLADGATVLVSTFECGLYRLKGLDGDSPAAELVYDFDAKSCAVPVQIDNFWIQPVPFNSIVTLDISDPGRPREVSRLALDRWDWPHWLSIEPSGRRFVLTGYFGLSNRVLVGTIDTHGNLTFDDRFGGGHPSESGIRLDRAEPHGAVFSIP